MTGGTETVLDGHGRPIRQPNSFLSSDGKELFRDRAFARRVKEVLEVVEARARLDENDQVFHDVLKRAIAKDSLLPTAGAASLCGNFLRLTELARPHMTDEEMAKTDVVQVEMLQRLLRNSVLDAAVGAGIALVPASSRKPDGPGGP